MFDAGRLEIVRARADIEKYLNKRRRFVNRGYIFNRAGRGGMPNACVDEPFSKGSCTIKLSLSVGISVGRSGEAAAAGGGGLRASGGEGAFCGPWPSMPANSANRKALATSETLSERLVAAWLATRSRPEWNDGDFGIPSGETARRGLVSAAVNIAREGARAAGPAWTIAGGGRQRHPSWSPAAPGPERAAGAAGLPRAGRGGTSGEAALRAHPPHPGARRSIQPPLGLPVLPRHSVIIHLHNFMHE